MRSLIQLPSFNGVAAGQTATLEIPTGGTYHGIQLTYTTTTGGGANQTNMEAELTAFRIKVNGNVQREFSFAQLVKMNAIHGVGFATGIVDIFFSQPWMRSPAGEDALAWGMADVSTFQLEIDIAAGAGAPTLSGLAVWENVARNMGSIVKWKRYSYTTSGAGVFTLTTLPKQDAYYGLHAFTNLITAAEVKVDQVQKFKATLAQATAYYARGGLAVPANLFPIVFNPTDRVVDLLDVRKPDGSMINELRFDLTASGGGTFTLLTETVGIRD